MAKLSVEQQIALWGNLEELQQTFPYTIEGLLLFASVCINGLIPGSPQLNRMQADILAFLLTGNKYRMIQAQRGQAKTTLTGIFCAFVLIHKPHYRIVIFSQTGKRAKEIAGWVIKIFSRMDFLDFMRPDRQEGDRDSMESYDINNVLKGGDKAPSVSCYSIESGAQGSRADIIFADDIESLQNSRSGTSRAWLEEQSKEFASINQYGDIIYLGTPQCADSIYNNLPARGYEVRVWTGRYPTEAELQTYGPYLAPILREDLERDPSLGAGGGVDGTRGKPTCPEMFPEQILVEKEIEFGKAKFDLQYMLNTRLSDADRYPLRLRDLVVGVFNKDQGPVMPIWSTALSCRVQDAPMIGNKDSDHFVRMFPKDYDWREWDRKVMYIDPSGGGRNGDEMAYGIVFSLGNFLYIYGMGGVNGGYSEEGLQTLVNVAKEAGVHEVYVEKNYGNGAHYAALKPLFDRPDTGYLCKLEEDYSLGQKELRIIDTLEPLMTTHRLVVRDTLLRSDTESTQRYSAEKRKLYSGFYQMSHITRDKDSLTHDDRVEAVSSACRKIMDQIAFDQGSTEAAARAEQMQEWLKIQNDPKLRREYFQAEMPTAPRHGNRFSTEQREETRDWGRLD